MLKSSQILLSSSFIPDPLRDIIARDLPESLLNEIQSQELDLQLPLSELIFGFYSASPLKLSAYYGSHNCFKLLMVLSGQFSQLIQPTQPFQLTLHKNQKYQRSNLSSESLESLADAAVIGGSIEIISLLKQMGADFSHSLTTAAEWRHPEVLKWILEQIEPYPDELILSNALKSAAKSDSAECVLILSEYASSRFSANALGIAARFKCEHAVLAFISSGCIDYLQKDELGMTPLHNAAIGGSKKIIEILLKQKPIAIKIKDDTGDTPVTLAKLNKHLQIADFLGSYKI